MPLKRIKPRRRPPRIPLPSDELLGRSARFEPKDTDRQMVRTLSGAGFPYEDIALVILDAKRGNRHISVPTLKKYFAEELRIGKVSAHAQIAGKIFAEAMKGNTTLLIFIAKTQMRWKEEREPPVGEATPVAIVFDLDDARPPQTPLPPEEEADDDEQRAA